MEKYLPIGTVCTLDSTNRKYVIAGYFSLEYNFNVKMYDYIGIPYPEGLLLHNKIVSFNHDDILNIDFLGFNDEIYNVFNRRMLQQSNEVDSFEQTNNLLYNFTFDENGVVVYEYETKSDEEINLNIFSKTNDIENPFNKKYDFSNQSSNSQNTNDWSIFEKYKFDENGNVVLEEKEQEIETDDTLLEEENEIIDNSNPKYEFDENGNVVLEEKEQEIETDDTLLEEENEIIDNSNPKYEFDENGFLVVSEE